MIEDSDWIAVHKAQGAIEPEEDYQHYKLNFNACGTLEVIAKGLELVAQQVDASESKPAGDP